MAFTRILFIGFSNMINKIRFCDHIWFVWAMYLIHMMNILLFLHQMCGVYPFNQSKKSSVIAPNTILYEFTTFLFYLLNLITYANT